MKLTMKYLILFFGLLILTNVANAESPREKLRQMVEQLQTNPGDDALREKIIKTAQKLKPAPAVPEEAERRMVRGTAAFKGAKSVADYRDAAKEFEQAALAAPWYGDAYYNLGVAQDKAENYEAALRSLKLAQLASPEVKEIKALIYEVEYHSENSPEALAAKKRDRDQALLSSLNGARYSYLKMYQNSNGTKITTTSTIDIRGNEVVMGNSFVASNGQEQAWRVSGRHPLNGRQFTTSAGGRDSWECKAECSPTCFKSTFDSGEVTWLCPMIGAISEDGNSIEFRGNGSTTIFRREL